MSRIHELKTWPEHFGPIVEGVKRCEIRLNDRDFQVGDCLVLQEYLPTQHMFSGEVFAARVLHLTTFEQRLGYVVMSIEPWAAGTERTDP